MQRTPAGLPLGMPGMGEEIDGAVQQAPQPGRQAGAVSGVVIENGWAGRERCCKAAFYPDAPPNAAMAETPNFFLYMNGAAYVALL